MFDFQFQIQSDDETELFDLINDRIVLKRVFNSSDEPASKETKLAQSTVDRKYETFDTEFSNHARREYKNTGCCVCVANGNTVSDVNLTATSAKLGCFGKLNEKSRLAVYFSLFLALIVL